MAKMAVTAGQLMTVSAQSYGAGKLVLRGTLTIEKAAEYAGA
jgi:hypothetical protein